MRRLAAFAALSLSITVSVSAAWRITEPDALVNADRLDLAAGPGGTLALTHDAPLTYAEWVVGTGWTSEVLDASGCAAGASFAYDPSGAPAMSYVDGSLLVYARRSGGRWVYEPVTPLPSGITALAYDAAGEPAIAYLDGAEGSVKLARRESGRWFVALVSSFKVSWVALVFDPSGAPVVAYLDARLGPLYLEVARWSGGAWTIDSLDRSAWDVASLALDLTGRLSVCYVEQLSESLRYAVWNGASWDVETVAPATKGTHCSLGYDPDGTPVIAYSGVRLARRVAGVWEIGDVAAGSIPNVSLAIGSARHVVFAGATGLAEARWNGAAWDEYAIHPLGGTYKWYGVSLAFDAAGHEAVSWVSGGELWFAQWDGSSWSTEHVRTYRPHSPLLTSLAFDRQGRPAIAFSYDLYGQIYLERRDGSVWTAEQLPFITGNYGISPVLRYDPDSHPLMCVWGNLMRWNAGWSTEVIEAGADWECSLAIDAGGQPRVSYELGGTLRYASFDGNTWTPVTVDATSGVGLSTALALDSAGLPWIAYHAGSGDLRLAHFDGVAWRLEVVDAAAGVERAVALDLDPAGAPAIAYRLSGGATRFARWTGFGWRIEEFCGGGHRVDLAFDPDDGVPVIARHQGDRLLVLRELAEPALLHRGTVRNTDPGWKAAALPLTPDNDDETPSLPMAVTVPGQARDLQVPVEPLLLYRLGGDDVAIGNVLRVCKDAAGVRLQF